MYVIEQNIILSWLEMQDPIVDAVQSYIVKKNLVPDQRQEVQKLGSTLRRMGLKDKNDCTSVTKGCVKFFHEHEIFSTGAKMLEDEFEIVKKPVVVESGIFII